MVQMVATLALIFVSSFLFPHLSIASFLDLCPLDSNATVSPASNITWGQATAGSIRQFGASSYIRPDIGGALLPWIYTVLVLLVHIPVVIIRVVKWEAVQTWCLAATLFTIAITIQAYASTGFSSQKILTWTPLLLVIDAGSMAQVFFLIVEEFSLFTRLRKSISAHKTTTPEDSLLKGHEFIEPSGLDEGVTFALHALNETAQITIHPTDSKHPPLLTSKPLYIAILALLLLITVFVLQIFGLSHAVNAAKATAPSVSWCSPIFQPFGVSVLDGNCNVWPIQQTFSKGVGCILIPGVQQKAWLEATVAGTGIAIALELLDIIILASVHSGTRWRGVKMRRPWFTMFSGIAVLGLMLVFGVVYASILPPGISQKVWVVTNAGAVSVYEGELGTAGLRGAMIGWNDGLFQAWGTTYFGSWDGS